MRERKTNQAPPEIPIACTLSGPEQRRRGEEITRLLLDGQAETDDLPDGYAVRFPGESIWATRLLTFILEERACCPFFTFELGFEPGQGPIWLRMRGPEGTKAFVAQMLGQAEEQTPARS